MSAFIAEATDACARLTPGIRTLPFGHLGDGNIHFSPEQPKNADPILDMVNAAVRRFDGSFSAEHGVGRRNPA